MPPHVEQAADFYSEGDRMQPFPKVLFPGPLQPQLRSKLLEVLRCQVVFKAVQSIRWQEVRLSGKVSRRLGES